MENKKKILYIGIIVVIIIAIVGFVLLKNANSDNTQNTQQTNQISNDKIPMPKDAEITPTETITE